VLGLVVVVIEEYRRWLNQLVLLMNLVMRDEKSQVEIDELVKIIVRLVRSHPLSR
jgi:hypothetical protein